MAVSLFLIALIGAVAFYQSIHGLFSAMIMCVITVLSLVFAFALHEYVALEWLIQWKPDFALPLSLAICFVVPLVTLRLTLDALLRRSCLLPSIVDRVGGVAFGLVTALCIMGVVGVALQMLPFGEPFLGFRQIKVKDEKFDPKAEPNGLLFSPDRFAVRLASLFSSGVFSGEREWRLEHPDYVTEIGWNQTAPRDVRCLAPRDAIQFVSMVRENYVYRITTGVNEMGNTVNEKAEPDPTYGKEGGRELWAVTFKPTSDAQDEDGKHRFALYQIRLVGRGRFGVMEQFHPIAVFDTKKHQRFLVRRDERGKTKWAASELYTPAADGSISVVFELPEVGPVSKGHAFEPVFLEYKMGARAAVKVTSDALPPAVAEETPPLPSERDGAGRPGPETRGRTHGADVTGASFGNALPHAGVYFTSVADAEMRDGELISGHVISTLETSGAGEPLHRLKVPEGKALLQVDVVNLRAGSLLGQAKSFAVKTVKNYLVTDESGAQYKICGQIAVADVGGRRVMEVQYFPEVIGSLGGVRGFQRIKDWSLKGDYELYFLFVVDSGRKITRFSTTGERGGEDISDLNLVAP
ncbi:MAG: CvpA family protein [Phycisphaerae bacterium]|nr:CvpA family protein [Phycisphaerae bacterium]